MPLTARDFTIVERSQTWRIIAGTHYRVCVIRTHDGRLFHADVRDDIEAGL